MDVLVQLVLLVCIVWMLWFSCDVWKEAGGGC